jgi:predicted acylesterase/phospholipase RssA
MGGGKPVLFRSYESTMGTSIPCTVWEAARATSAAPTIFKRIYIGQHKEPFIDGGLGRNNPTEEVLSEAKIVFPGRRVACVISIGTGHPKMIKVPNPGIFEKNVVPVRVIEAVVSMASDCEATAGRMVKYFENQPRTYFRFNVEHGLEDVKLSDWDRTDEVAAQTRHYMTHEVGPCLDDAVTAMLGRSTKIRLSKAFRCVAYPSARNWRVAFESRPLQVLGGRQG